MRGGTTLAFAALPALALLTAAAVWLITAQQLIASSSSFAAPPPSLAARLGVSEAHIIALDPDAPHVQGLRRLNEHWLGIPTRAMRAVNGTQALVDRPLPLYTRMLLSVGRHEHMQLGGPAMLGTLLSHMRLWNNDTNTVIMVLEEDALIDAASRERLLQLAADTAVALPDWDILMLETGHLTVAGPMRPVGQLGVTWAREEAATAAVLVPPEAACFWMGTRGYILRPSGARKLLRHAAELTVQVDALLGLVATFDPDFRMVWTRANVAHPRLLSLSTTQDRCIKCFMPQGALTYLALLALGVGVVASISVGARAKAVGLFVAGNMIGPPALDWLAARMAHDPRLRWYARPLRDAGALALRAATFYYGASMSSSQLADMVAGLKQQIEALRKKEADDIAAIENSIQR